MNLKQAKGLLAYLVVGLVSTGLAFFVATQFITPSRSQTPDAPPPEPVSPAPAPEVELTMPPTQEAGGTPAATEGAPPAPEGGLPPPLPEGQVAPAPGDQPPAGDAAIDAGLEGIPKFTDFQTFLEPFIYDPKNRKDPFKPYVEVEPVYQGELQGPLLPLQRFDLNEIRLVGIIFEVREPKAMFLDPTNTVHIIGKNERIGRNNGYIAVIREGEVVVVEATRKENEVIYTTTVMKISR